MLAVIDKKKLIDDDIEMNDMYLYMCCIQYVYSLYPQHTLYIKWGYVQFNQQSTAATCNTWNKTLNCFTNWTQYIWTLLGKFQ